ncbi:hypothetical protein, partial [Microbulbifer taiwanensis]|uniref:hypothetical protein n=1 Tax=Microbulbifer taiwanensis TaxID=986746 RepID=UPI001D00860C
TRKKTPLNFSTSASEMTPLLLTEYMDRLVYKCGISLLNQVFMPVGERRVKKHRSAFALFWWVFLAAFLCR